MLSTEEFIERSKKKYPNKFTYENTIYLGRREQVTITCKVHGDFQVNAGNHMYHTAGCPICSKMYVHTTEIFINEAKRKFPNYDYSKVKYINNKTNVTIICPKHGEFQQTPSNFFRSNGCRECQKEIFKEEYKKYFLEKAKDIFSNKYDYSKSNIVNSRNKIKIICPIHGEFEQEPYIHLNSVFGCPKCQEPSNKGVYKLSTEEFINKAKLIHGNKYDYSILKYNGYSNDISYICKEHGIVTQKAYHHLRGTGCPFCSESHGERNIRIFLESKNINYRYEAKIYELNKIFNLADDENKFLSYDFYIEKYNLLIEYNGEQHYNNVFGKPRKEFLIQLHHDWLKRKYAKKNNIDLLIIPYWEFNNIDNILTNKIINSKI